MYPAPFAYHRATSLADAQQLLAANPGAKLLAGGHSLLPLMKLRLASPDGARGHRPRAGAERHHREPATACGSAP